MQAVMEQDVAKKKASMPRSESRKMDKQVRVSSEAWELAESVARLRGISGAEFMSMAIIEELFEQHASISDCKKPVLVCRAEQHASI